MAKPYIALVGRPNTGKSTLFNRLAKSRISIVDNKPGVTRDRIIAEAEWLGNYFFIIDTGGIELDSKDEIPVQMKRQAQLAIDMADVVVFIVDSRSGLLTGDIEIAEMIRRRAKSFVLAVNKIDDPTSRIRASEFYALSLGEPYPISAEHGLGIGDLLDAVLKKCPPNTLGEGAENIKSIAVVGKPNVGKSTLVNTLAGEERMIVSNIPGTTRDAVDSFFTYHGEQYKIIDTAGLKKRSRIYGNIEFYASVRAAKAIESSDVCLLMIDAQQGVTEQDTKIASMVASQQKALVIVMNKWDLVEKQTNTMAKMGQDTLRALHFVSYAQVVFISAIEKRRLDKLMPAVNAALQEYSKRVNTGLLNDALSKAHAMSPPPSKKGNRLRIFYSSQVGVKPPTFVLFVNDKSLASTSYTRYLEGKIRSAFGFSGSPIKITYKNRGEN
ncbi:MAG: ribosome biogenesis GTPase Der [Eubacteriaceae bacterium]|nr:ribosome biogenesis GTPase Der [Eubacteriaceae bacterium]